jgi:hypothetical protein
MRWAWTTIEFAIFALRDFLVQQASQAKYSGTSLRHRTLAQMMAFSPILPPQMALALS